MSKSVNEVILIGHVGQDPDIRRTTEGKLVANLSLATNRRPREGEEEGRTDWHRLTVWDKAAEIVEKHVRQGTQLYVRGELQYGSYEREGVTVPTAEIVVHDFTMLGKSD